MPSPAPVPIEPQARAWLHALTPGADARDRLAEALAEGASPWSTAAVTQGWRAVGATTMLEAVVNAESLLGQDDTLARLALMARHAMAGRPPHADAIVRRVLMAAVERRWPMAAVDAWCDVAPSTARFAREAFPLLAARVLAGENGAPDLLRWMHRRVRAIQAWPTAHLQALEATDHGPLREAYWALHRQAARRPGRA